MRRDDGTRNPNRSSRIECNFRHAQPARPIETRLTATSRKATMPAKPNNQRRSPGPRPMAGAKKIDPALKKLSGSIALTESEWTDLDNRRGTTPRGRYIAKKLKLGGKP